MVREHTSLWELWDLNFLAFHWARKSDGRVRVYKSTYFRRYEHSSSNTAVRIVADFSELTGSLGHFTHGKGNKVHFMI